MDRENFQTPPDGEPTKPTKPGFVSFVSRPPESIEKISWLERLKILKQGATSTNPATGAPCPDPADELEVADKPALADTLATVHDDRELCPYRIALDGHAQLVWLEAGLSSAEVVERARTLYGAECVADPGVAPADGWPRLSDIPELPPSDGPPMPEAPCPACACPCWWRASPAEPWRCQDCDPPPRPCPESLTVPGGRRRSQSAVSREDLIQSHPATVAGVPLGDVLAQAEEGDLLDLMDLTVLEAFAKALLASGSACAASAAASSAESAAEAIPGAVRCCDCAHFEPDTVGDGTGIGQCGEGRQPRAPEPPLYPAAPRRCAAFAAKETPS